MRAMGSLRMGIYVQLFATGVYESCLVSDVISRALLNLIARR